MALTIEDILRLKAAFTSAEISLAAAEINLAAAQSTVRLEKQRVRNMQELLRAEGVEV